MTCPQCFDAGWVLDAKLDKEPTTLELIPCIYPPCEQSGREVAVLCLYGEWGSPVLHPTTGGVMSLSHMPPEARHFRAPRPRTVDEAEAQGYTVDRHCYPWVAYKGPRFDPDVSFPISTPAT